MGLWGAAFDVPKKDTTKKIVDKVKNPKETKVKTVRDVVKSNAISVEEKVRIITDDVYRILGHYKDNTICIREYNELVNYIQAGNKEKILAIDTETNNSLDPITCKLMGLCLYAPGQKSAYVPVNHVDLHTQELLPNQLTEFQIHQALNLIANDTVCIFHNGKFDYSVIKCTCGYECHIDWDTQVAAKVLDENELSARLKDQYRTKIDPEQEKYDIEHLFQKMEYAVFPPEVFALYAATDSYITYRLYEWQKKQFEIKSNANLYKMFLELEMPLVKVIAELQMEGMGVDQEYAKRLSSKYHKLMDDVDSRIQTELDLLKPTIDQWRLTPEATNHPITRKGKEGKSKSEQLSEPINLGSPTQLAILFYDILKAPQVSKQSPRGTGEDILEELDKKIHSPLLSLILERRGYVKLLSTYIDIIPELAHQWPDGRVRTHFNQYGAATGRLSSSEPLNFQNIPSKNREIRLLFCASTKSNTVYTNNDIFTVHTWEDVETPNGWVKSKDLIAGDTLLVDGNIETIKDIILEGRNIRIYI